MFSSYFFNIIIRTSVNSNFPSLLFNSSIWLVFTFAVNACLPTELFPLRSSFLTILLIENCIKASYRFFFVHTAKIMHIWHNTK